MSSSTSSSDEAAWRGFFKCFLIAYAISLGGIYAFIVLVDPFDVLPLSLDVERHPIAGNQRFAFPGIARKDRFDSAVVGTSTVMLLDPEELSRDLGGRFVTLAMGAATHYEQRRMLGVFARHHPQARTVILALDTVWLSSEPNRRRYGPYRFPEWMYDANRWNDYAHHLDLYALGRAWRQATGARPTFRDDGYKRFVPEGTKYDPVKVHEHLYGPAARAVTETWSTPGLEATIAFDFDAIDEALALLPQTTEKILVLPPMHVVAHPPLRLAKRALVEHLRGVANVRIVDFLFSSRITTTDANYWDPGHYTTKIASQISRLLAASRDPGFQSDVCRVLLRTGAE